MALTGSATPGGRSVWARLRVVLAGAGVRRCLGYLVRFGALGGTVVLVGGVLFVRLLWPGGARVPRLRRLLAAAWFTTAGSTLALFVLQGPYGASRPLADLRDVSLLAVTWATPYGKLLGLRLLALAGAAAAWPGTRRNGAAPGWFDTAGLTLLGLESFSFSGHLAQGSWVPLAAGVDAIHLLAAAVWIGGPAALAVLLIDPGAPAPDSDGDSTGQVLAALLPRWSRVAMLAVGALAATGA